MNTTDSVRTEDSAPYIVSSTVEQIIRNKDVPFTSEEENEVIALAIQILDSRMRKPGQDLLSPNAVKQFLKIALSEYDYEVFLVVFLNTQNKVIHHEEMFRGTIDGTSVYPREIARKALEVNAKNVIFAHNHPSGNVTPSQADVQITRKLSRGLEMFDIVVLDHFIVGETMYSMKEDGLI